MQKSLFEENGAGVLEPNEDFEDGEGDSECLIRKEKKESLIERF